MSGPRSPDQIERLRSLVADTLPPWSGRAGYTENDPDGDSVFPRGVLAMPWSDAPHGSLDAVFYDAAVSGHEDLTIARAVTALRPGGRGLLLFDREVSLAELESLAGGAGAEVIGLPDDRRRTTGWRTVALIESSLSERSALAPRLSVVLAVYSDVMPDTAARIRSWLQFLKNSLPGARAELVLVYDGPLLEVEGLDSFREDHRLREFRHFRSFGPAEALRTGLVHAGGRRVVVDGGPGTPVHELKSLLVPVFQATARKEVSARPVVVVGVDPEGRAAMHLYEADEARQALRRPARGAAPKTEEGFHTHLGRNLSRAGAVVQVPVLAQS